MLYLFRGKKNVTENGDVDVLSNGGKSTSQEDTVDKVGRKESKKSMLSLFRDKKNVTENGDVEILSNGGKSTSQEDVQIKENDQTCKESKKSMLSLFHGRKSIVDGKT